MASNVLHDWLYANARDPAVSRGSPQVAKRDEVGWKKPTIGVLKINIDAECTRKKGQELGMMIRDH